MSAFVDSELTGTEMLSIRKHLVTCSRCEAEYQSLAQLKRLLSSLPSSSPRAELTSSLEDLSECSPFAVRLIRRRREMRRVFGLASADENFRAMQQASGHAAGLACALGVLGAWFVVAPAALAPVASHLQEVHPRLGGILLATGLMRANHNPASSVFRTGTLNFAATGEPKFSVPLASSLPVPLSNDSPQYPGGYGANGLRRALNFSTLDINGYSYRNAPSGSRLVSANFNAPR